MGVEDGSTSLLGLVLLTIGTPPRELVERIIAGLSRRVSVPCRLAAVPPGFEVSFLDHRTQVDADTLLRRLEALPRPAGHWLVGLTELDLGNPIFTFFFGRARHGGGAAVVSLARLLPSFYGMEVDDALTVRRAITEILHELGHVAGIGHCDDYQCLLHFARTVEDIDNRGDSFCDACHKRLPPGLGGTRTHSRDPSA